MIAKVIEVRVKPGHVDAFLERQTIWDTESRLSDGYLGQFCGIDDTGSPIVITFWESVDAYEEWMDAEHDRIAVLARSDTHYDSIRITIVG